MEVIFLHICLPFSRPDSALLIHHRVQQSNAASGWGARTGCHGRRDGGIKALKGREKKQTERRKRTTREEKSKAGEEGTAQTRKREARRGDKRKRKRRKGEAIHSSRERKHSG